MSVGLSTSIHSLNSNSVNPMFQIGALVQAGPHNIHAAINLADSVSPADSKKKAYTLITQLSLATISGKMTTVEEEIAKMELDELEKELTRSINCRKEQEKRELDERKKTLTQRLTLKAFKLPENIVQTEQKSNPPPKVATLFHINGGDLKSSSTKSKSQSNGIFHLPPSLILTSMNQKTHEVVQATKEHSPRNSLQSPGNSPIDVPAELPSFEL